MQLFRPNIGNVSGSPKGLFRVPWGNKPAGGPVIPPIAAGATYDWAIEDLALANDDPISAWVDSIGGISADGAGGVRPLYKTGITPTGKPVARFDGVDDTLVGVTLANVKHLFAVAAFRPATSNAGESLLTINVGSGYFWYVDGSLTFSFAVSTFGTPRRDGVDTAAVYPSGQFAVYEFLFTDPPLAGGMINGDIIFARDRGQPTYGPWDICRVLSYPNEVTGQDLINTRDNLTQTYIAA